MDEKLLTIVEAASLMRIGKTKIYELMMNGQLRSVLIGRARRIEVDAIDDFIRRAASEEATDG